MDTTAPTAPPWSPSPPWAPEAVYLRTKSIGSSAGSPAFGSSPTDEMYLVQLMKNPRKPIEADKPEPGKELWVDLAGFGEAGVSVEPGEVDEVVYDL